MQIHEVENMSVEELQSRKHEVVETLVAGNPEDVVSRYVQARLDAGIRDAKLSEQAKTLEALQDGIEAAKAGAVMAETLHKKGIEAITEREAGVADAGLKAIQDLQAKVRDITEEVEGRVKHIESQAHSSATEAARVIAQHVATIDGLTAQAASQGAEIGRLDDTVVRLVEQANKYSEAISSIQKLSLDAINAKLLADAN